MQRYRIATVSLENDLHSLAIEAEFAKHADVQFHAIDSNRLAGSNALSWSNDGDFTSTVSDRHGNRVPIGDLNVIWWRRVRFPQLLPPGVSGDEQIDLINNDCRISLEGSLLNEFRGTWVSHPINTQLAENMLLQLRVAQRAGFRVPRTLVSQDPRTIRAFCDGLSGDVVVKSVRGTALTQLFTQKLRPEHLKNDENLELAPAMYQELIAGSRHVRLNAFGDEMHAFEIDSPDLDWRGNLNVSFAESTIPAHVAERIRAVLTQLGLRMGVVDLKLTDDGEPVWLEINPQGQFLFAEGLTGSNLTAHFARFLYSEAVAAKHRNGDALTATSSRRAP